MVKSWEKHIDRLRSQIFELRETLSVIKDTTHEERPGLEETTAQFRELVNGEESLAALYQFPKILQSILVNPAIGAIVFGPGGEHLLFNAAAERILGSDLMADTQTQIAGNFGFYLADKTTRCAREQLPWQLSIHGQKVHEMTLFVRRQGVTDGVWVKVTCTPLKNENGQIGGAVSFLADTTEQVQVEHQIESLCDNLEQQFSLLGSAQYELKLLTDKLAKIEWSTEAPATRQLSGQRQVDTLVAEQSGGSATPAVEVDAVAVSQSDEEEPAGSEVVAEIVSSDAVARSDASDVVAEIVSSDEVVPADAQDVMAQIVPSGAVVPADASDVVAEIVSSGAVVQADASDVVAQAQAPDAVSDAFETASQSSQEAEPLQPVEVQIVPESDLEQAVEAPKPGKREAADKAKLEKPESKAARELRKLSSLLGDDEQEVEKKIEEQPVPQQQPVPVKSVKKSAAQLLMETISEELQAVPDTKSAETILQSFEPDGAEPAEGVIMTEPATTAAQPAKAAEAETNKKILVVDDIPVNQKLLRLQLKRLGFESYTANNGEAALESIKAHDFALILMDLDMPVMDGFESTVAIRKLEEGANKHVPIVAMTSYDREGDRERCLSIGMDDFLSKGATQKQLKEVIDRCVQPPKEATFWGAAPINTAPADKEASEPKLNIDSLQKQFDKEEVQDVSRLFLSAVHTFIDCIQLGIEEKDAGAVTHFAHSVKGPCAALGIEEMTRLTSEIMSNAESGNWTQVRVKYLKLKSSFGEVRDQLRELCRPDYLLTS